MEVRDDAHNDIPPQADRVSTGDTGKDSRSRAAAQSTRGHGQCRPHPADDRPGPDDHRHRPAAHAGGPGDDRVPEPVDGHRLQPGLRRPRALRGKALRRGRHPPLLPGRSDRIRDRQPRSRDGDLLPRPAGGPRGPGLLRRPAGPHLAVTAQCHLHRAHRARAGLRDLRRHWRPGSGRRAACRRSTDRLVQLALGPLHQHSPGRRRPAHRAAQPPAGRPARPRLTHH